MTQASNKSNNHYVIYEGISKTISEWAREVNLPYNVLCRRINKGWDIKKALTKIYKPSIISPYTTRKEYKIWKNIKRRCQPDNENASLYFDRGISVCERWQDSFDNFLEDVGFCPEKCTSIDRIDNNKGYEPGNVRWADSITQANNKRNNRYITYKDTAKTLSQWSKDLNIPYNILKRRLNRKWTIEQAFTQPIKQINKLTP